MSTRFQSIVYSTSVGNLYSAVGPKKIHSSSLNHCASFGRMRTIFKIDMNTNKVSHADFVRIENTEDQQTGIGNAGSLRILSPSCLQYINPYWYTMSPGYVTYPNTRSFMQRWSEDGNGVFSKYDERDAGVYGAGTIINIVNTRGSNLITVSYQFDYGGLKEVNPTDLSVVYTWGMDRPCYRCRFDGSYIYVASGGYSTYGQHQARKYPIANCTNNDYIWQKSIGANGSAPDYGFGQDCEFCDGGMIWTVDALYQDYWHPKTVSKLNTTTGDIIWQLEKLTGGQPRLLCQDGNGGVYAVGTPNSLDSNWRNLWHINTDGSYTSYQIKSDPTGNTDIDHATINATGCKMVDGYLWVWGQYVVPNYDTNPYHNNDRLTQIQKIDPATMLPVWGYSLYAGNNMYSGDGNLQSGTPNPNTSVQIVGNNMYCIGLTQEWAPEAVTY